MVLEQAHAPGIDALASALPRVLLFRFAFTFLLSTFLLSSLPAQNRADEVLRPSRPVKLLEGVHRNDLIVVKFVEEQRVRLNTSGVLVSPSGLDLSTPKELIGSRKVTRMFTRAVDDLDEERRTLMANRGRYLADLNNYFHVQTNGRADSEALLEDLLDDKTVETAYPEWTFEGIVPISAPAASSAPAAVSKPAASPAPAAIVSAPPRAILPTAGFLTALCPTALLPAALFPTAWPTTTLFTATLFPGSLFPATLLPDLTPTTPDFETRQSYFLAAPTGFGHVLTRGIDGAEGLASQLVVQLEGSWVLGHEDIENLVSSNVISTTNFGSYNRSSWYNHGTACVGILNAGRNIYGVRGFAPLSTVKVASLANGAANMISLATAQAKAGDVFTSSFAHVVAGGKHAPVDYPQANFDAVKTATAKGICYTYGAGNTSTDLGNTSIYGARYVASAPDSGGFIIGATSAGGTSRVGFSNFGTKVIANGWGNGVATTGYGSLFKAGNDRRQDYTATFGGTSAAGPLVAGVLASLQGASIRQTGKPLTPAQVRAALKVHGTQVTGNIGLRPDLAKLMIAFKLLDGLHVAREATIGDKLELEVAAASGRFWVLFMAPQRGRADVGLNRNLLLEVATHFVVAGGAMPTSGEQTVTFGVPNDKNLSGRSVFAQALDTSTAFSDLHLSNSIEVYVR